MFIKGCHIKTIRGDNVGKKQIVILMILVISLLVVCVDTGQAKTVESINGYFEVIYPDEIAVSEPFTVQIKVNNNKIRKQTNLINLHGCDIMDSSFEDEGLKSKLPPIGQRSYTEYHGEELVTLELAAFPFANPSQEYERVCSIEFQECDGCKALAFTMPKDEVEFPINRDETLTTNMHLPVTCDDMNLKEGHVSCRGIEGESGRYDLGLNPHPYPYSIEAYGDKLYFADEDELERHIQARMDEESDEAIGYTHGGGNRAFYSYNEAYRRSSYEEDETYTVRAGVYGAIFYSHYVVDFDFDLITYGVSGSRAPAVQSANEQEFVEVIKSFSISDGTTEYSGEFMEDAGKIEYEEKDNEPKYPLYDPYFDYDGDGMLDDEEYADFYEAEHERIRLFNENYNDTEKIEYKKEEPTQAEGEPTIRQEDLFDIFADVNAYEGAILQKSDVIVGEVKGVKEDIDRLSKRINALKSSFKVLAQDSAENKDALDELLERIKVSQDELEEKTRLQTDMIKSIDKEYAILLKKLDKDISMTIDDDVRGVLEDKRKSILDNARYAKVNAYFHSGNDAEFEKIAQKMRLGTDSDIVSKISLLTGLKKLERGMPQSALHDFKSAMVEDPDNPVARDLTNKIETAYLDSIETKLMAEMQGDAKAYEKSNQVGKDGAFNYAGDLLTTGIGSSTGALFGYEEAKALESDILQTEVSKQIAGIQITKALMGSGMTLKEVKALKTPEEFQELAKTYGKEITAEQAKKYREMVHQAHANPDVEKISDNSLMPLQVDSRRSYYKNNYNKEFVTQVLDVVNVKNVIVTLGPSAVFTKGGEIVKVKDFVRKTAKIDRIQRALMTTKAGTDTTRTGRFLSWISTRLGSGRLGKEMKTISQYGDARKFLIGQGFGMVENEVIGKGAELMLGKEKGKVFADFYDGFMAFTGFTDIGDMSDVAGKMDDSEFVEDFTEGLQKGMMKKDDLMDGRDLMGQEYDEAVRVSGVESAEDARKKVLGSLSSKNRIDDEALDQMKEKITSVKASLEESESKVAELKRTQLQSAEDAITAYKNKDFDTAKKMMEKSGHMDEMISETVDDLRVRHKMSEKVAEIAESAPDVPEQVDISGIIQERPLKVGDTQVPVFDVDANTGKVTIHEAGSMDISITINDNVPNKGWAKVIENADDMSKAIGYSGIQEELDTFTMKLLDLVVKKTVPGAMKTAVDTSTEEYVFVLDLPNSNSILVKVDTEGKEDDEGKTMAEVTNALVMTDRNFKKNVDKDRYRIIEDNTK